MPIGVLRHGSNIYKGLTQSPFPTVGLQAIVYPNSTYEDSGTTYIRTSLGIGLPVISGTGLDRIIDFAPLNDVRFDKGSYVGNAYGLPATYNYPYVGIYYDATSEATRYHWKMTDFGYAVILAQSLLVDDMFFLKATATTDTSNVIASVDRLFIYSVALTGANKTKMKTYIGIQDTFYSANLLPEGNFATDTNADGIANKWDGLTDFVNSSYSILPVQNGFTTKQQRSIKLTSTGYLRVFHVTENIYTAGLTYILSSEYRSNISFIMSVFDGVTTYQVSCDINEGNAALSNLKFTSQGVGGLYPIRLYGTTSANVASSKYIEVGNIQLNIEYQNYYKS